MARWGAHRERVEQTRRQRFGVAGRKTSERARKRARRISRPQHERSVQDVSFTSEQRPQLQRPGARTERCTVQNASSVFEQRAQRACTQITTRAAHAHDLEAELIQVGGWDSSSDSEGGRAVEGSEEHFDESEHVDDLAEEERSTDGEDGFGEEVDKTRENEGEGCRSPEGSDFAAEEGYEEDDSNTEEGHEGVWGEVQEALSSMGNEDYDETALCARSQASRSSSSS